MLKQGTAADGRNPASHLFLFEILRNMGYSQCQVVQGFFQQHYYCNGGLEVEKDYYQVIGI